ncbi:MAG: TetR family transcriptional regulator [Actinomycetales bacterium]|nr:TetR family transcriptional regulator [Actinomycetales bacterium]
MTAAAEAGRAPLSERGRRTRARLIVAARHVFEERGFDGTRMGDIAAAAGVSHGTVYTWFPTKEDALHAVVDSVTEEMYSVLSTPDVSDPVERIAVANARYLQVYRDTARLMEVVAQAAVVDGSFRAVLDGLRHTHVNRVTKSIRGMQREGVAEPSLDARISAAALCAMVEGFARNWLGGGEGGDTALAPDTHAVRTLTELWARALGLIETGGR